MSAIPPSALRINFTVDKTRKKLVERAAAIKGLTPADLAAEALYQEAAQVVNNDGVHVLSDRDRDAFLAALDNPPSPPAKLLKAARV